MISYSDLQEKDYGMYCDSNIPKLQQSLVSASTIFRLGSDTSFLDSQDKDSDRELSDEDDLNCTVANETTVSSRKRRLKKWGNAVDPWIQQAWFLHFVVGLAVLIYSVWCNGGKR